ncbi:MAG TPA: hypothetical protein VHL59_11655, partial [Thermoanaerobaculia bacterium]|nr:hypothetical protein [Thermoanaerobaculia bacterium]
MRAFKGPNAVRLRTAAIIVSSLAAMAAAQEPPAHSTTIDVIAVTPIDGIGLDRAKFPTNAQRIARTEGTDAAEVMVRGSASVEANDPQGGLLQPDLQFRGFSVSPLLGAPEGLALFQDGV